MPYSGSFIAKFCFRLDISVAIITIIVVADSAFACLLARSLVHSIFFPPLFSYMYVIRKFESTTKAYLKRVFEP